MSQNVYDWDFSRECLQFSLSVIVLDKVIHIKDGSHIICSKTYSHIYMKLLLLKNELFCCHQKNNKKDIEQAERVHFQRMLKKIVVSNFLKLPTKTKTLNAFTTFGKGLQAKRCFVFFVAMIYNVLNLHKEYSHSKKKTIQTKILLLAGFKQFAK